MLPAVAGFKFKADDPAIAGLTTPMKSGQASIH